MPDATKLVSNVALAVLLLDARSLLRFAHRRDRQSFLLQLRLVFACWLLRRTWDSLRERPVVKKYQHLFCLPASVSTYIERWSQHSLAEVAFDAVVPAALALAGLANVMRVGGAAARRWRDLLFRQVLVFGSVPTLLKAVEERFGEEVDVMAVLSLELGLVMGEQAAAAVILVMLTGGEALEHFTFNRARQSLRHVMDEAAPRANRLKGQSREDLESFLSSPRASWDADDPEATETELTLEIEEVDAEEISPGDLLAIRAGEAVPVDGLVLSPRVNGRTQSVVVDERVITGEGAASVKGADDQVLSGSIGVTPLWLQATVGFAGSNLELMRTALRDSLERKAPLQRTSAQAAGLLQPLTLGAAALSILVRRRASAKQRWKAVLAVMMSATPCPASIGVPIAFLGGMSVAARRGVLIKSAAAIEAIAKATHVVFDKTGTITSGKPVVRRFQLYKSSKYWTSSKPGSATSKDACAEVLRLAASLEASSTHPLAEGIVKFARSHNLELLTATSADCIHGYGIDGIVAGKRVIVGHLNFLKRQGVDTACADGPVFDSTCLAAPGRIDLSEAAPVPQPHDGAAKRVGELETYIAIGDSLVARFGFEDALRPGTVAAVERLRGLGIRVEVLSGDRSERFRDAASELRCDLAKGACLPHEKSEHINQLVQANAKATIVMVGDEANDAPALASAHVGICVGTQSGLASASAEVVLSAADGGANPVESVLQLVILCRSVVHTATRGVRCGLGLSAAQVALATTGLLPPKLSAILQEVTDLSALANAASVLRHV
eukprot:TRINITY_DN102089_c0_g1_i1.p1 TRINITY_DN102089_c0_g1~~TRINITY_DN102089_c0_g1_i1.p1  ORF type:complete len:784 (+),score=152.74 TRINITY_DN102089_c0_g1_i1:165-2516(+)